MIWNPHGYQKQAVTFGVERATAGFFLDPGLGKTVILLTIFAMLKKKGLLRRLLVIAPLRPAHSVWPAEVAKWDHLSHLTVSVLHGADKEAILRDGADVQVINPEGLDWLVRHARTSPREPWPWQMLVVDESTRFKHANTQRFKTLKPILQHFHRRYILTGSPAPNGLLDLFGQVFILDLGRSLGQFISHYKLTFFDQTGYMNYVSVPKPGAEEKIYKLLQPLVLRMSAVDLLDLPPLVYNRVEVELPKAARKAYDQMESQLITLLEDEAVTAANAAAAWGKCRQIANGGIYHDGGEKWTHIHEEKAEAVGEIIEELSGKPALVAFEYKHDLDRLRRQAWGKDAPYIGGGVATARFREIERAWNRGEVPVLLAQPQSVAHGLNLQGTGAAVIFHSLTPDLEVDEQFIRRVWRQGQKERVVVHRIVAKKTVDEVVMGLLHKKDRDQKALLAALRSYAGGRRAA